MNSLNDDYPAVLLAEREAPCLSLYQPTHRQHPDNTQDSLRFRNLVNQLAASLREQYPTRDISALLQPFEALLRASVPLTIACDRLIRVDFAAAGAVLNWAAEQQGQGHVVQFRNLQRLVAIFFNVIGINEHAWVIPRKN